MKGCPKPVSERIQSFVRISNSDLSDRAGLFVYDVNLFCVPEMKMNLLISSLCQVYFTLRIISSFR